MAEPPRRRPEYLITVVDRHPAPFPGPKGLIAIGVPVPVAARWSKVRREFTVAGLSRKLVGVQN